MVGGGVLSLPYAVARSGLLLGLISLLVSAAASAWSFEMLVDCSRRTGRDSYMMVAQAAGGHVAQQASITMVFLVCWLGLIAYSVLIGDLLDPVVQYLLASETQSPAPFIRQVLMLGTGLIISPMCLQNRLGALRFLCFASVLSVCAVTTFIGWSAFSRIGETRRIYWVNEEDHEEYADILPTYRLFPEKWVDAAYAVPVFGVSFLCHFNALPAHQELSRPTRFRIRRVVLITMGCTTVLYALIGNFGYLFAAEQTCGNVLLNFSVRDIGATCARIALSVVLTFNFPLLVLPAREALYSVLQSVHRCVVSHPAILARRSTVGVPLVDGQAESVAPRRTTSQSSRSSPQVHVYVSERSASRPEAVDAFQPKDQAFQNHNDAGMPLPARVLTTALVLGSALALACSLRSVLVVWSILGSTVALFIACILPAGFWLQITGGAAGSGLRICTVCLAVITSVLSLVCTVLAADRLNAPPCPGLNPGTFSSREILLQQIW